MVFYRRNNTNINMEPQKTQNYQNSHEGKKKERKQRQSWRYRIL